MKRMPTRLVLFIVMTVLMVLLAGFTSIALAQTDTPGAEQPETPIPPAEGAGPPGTQPPADQAVITPTPTQPAAVTLVDELPSSASELFTFEGPITRWVADLAAKYGWRQVSFLSLTLEDWINFALSVLIFVLIYLSGRWLVNRGLREVFERASIETGADFLVAVRTPINWLMIIVALQISLARLAFLGHGLRVFLNQVFFIAYLTIITIFVWKTALFASEVILKRGRTEQEITRLRPIYLVARRVIEFLLLIVYFSIFLSYFGIDITAFAAALGIGGLALSLAAQDTLSDAIAGFLILLDQPFRVGDRIEIAGLGTWGDVVQIGTRSTRIRTRDNRLVIVPNSAIAKDQIVNYTYPDPRYRVQIDLGLDSDTDLKVARQVAIDAVRQVQGVLPDKPVDALFVDFGDSSITFRVRWWIHSYVDTRRMFDKVNEALLEGFTKANINIPNLTYDVHLKVDDQHVRQFPDVAHIDQPEGSSDQSSAAE